MGRSGQRRIRRVFLTDAIVKDMVAGGLGVDRRALRAQRHGHGQFAGRQVHQCGGILGGVQVIGKDQGNRLAHETHTALCEHGAFGGGAFAAIPVVDQIKGHAQRHALRQQVIRCQNGMHAGGGAGLGQIQRGDVGMGGIGSQEIGMQRIFWRDIIDITTLPRQETQIFAAAGGLRLAEFHAASFLWNDRKTTPPAGNVQPGAQD